MFTFTKRITDLLATKLSAIYGNPIMIWASIIFTIIGAFVTDEVLNKMLYWSNGAQLIFCFVSVYVALLSVQSHKKHAEKLDAIHKALKEAKK